MNLTIRRGNVSFMTETDMTIEDVCNLAKAAKIAGIPSTAAVTHISFRYGYGPAGTNTEIDLSWQVNS
jgi:hypothetical protein